MNKPTQPKSVKSLSWISDTIKELTKSTLTIRIAIHGTGLAAILLTGCATMKVPEFKAAGAASYEYHAATNGLAVAVHPVTEKEEMRKTFRTDLLKQGVLPILIVVENNSSASYLLAKERVYVLEGETGSTSGNATAGIASGGSGETLAMTGAALTGVAVVAAPAAVVIGAPLMIAGAKAMSDADVIKHNLADKALASHTVGPKQKEQGFIYFRLPKLTDGSEGRRVVVELVNPDNHQPLTFTFNIK